MEEKKDKGFFGRMSERISDVLTARAEIDEDMFDDMEEVLITSDMGMDTTMHIMDRIRETVKNENIKKPETVKVIFRKIMSDMLDKGERQKLTDKTPLVILMIGINGGGKTTTIGKLAYKLKNEGKTVSLAAADTFRAAAGEQLSIWADRIGVSIVRHDEGTDPAAVIYDGIQSAKAKETDILICDTAGRLNNKANLMAELEKMNKVIGREFPEASQETLLVLDATTGKNAVSQVKEFGEVTELTGVVLTKMDGTAKGGIAVTISDEFDVPVKYIGTGEKIEDLSEFDPWKFTGGIFNE